MTGMAVFAVDLTVDGQDWRSEGDRLLTARVSSRLAQPTYTAPSSTGRAKLGSVEGCASRYPIRAKRPASKRAPRTAQKRRLKGAPRRTPKKRPQAGACGPCSSARKSEDYRVGRSGRLILRKSCGSASVGPA